uniref:Immunoglobulin V-set domain-containing protein n=1 Tax=Scophthalmus maximus TaxID=52904 RepID=A0A8D3ABE6_SCOMX
GKLIHIFNVLILRFAVTPRFVLTGKDLLLDILSPVVVVENSDFKWKFQLNVTHNENVLKLYYGNKTKISVRYEGRTKISLQNYSLHLRNMQQADSGLYSAWINCSPLVHKPLHACVPPSDPVSPVELTVDYVSNSSDSCNLAVTCSTRDSHHINNLFTCDSKNCSHEEGGERSKVTTSGASLRVYLGDDSSIVCEHSNQVSSAKNNSMIEHFCPKTALRFNLESVFCLFVFHYRPYRKTGYHHCHCGCHHNRHSSCCFLSSEEKKK